MTRIMGGHAMADACDERARVDASTLYADIGGCPTLAVVLLGADAASEIHVRCKLDDCVTAKLGHASAIPSVPGGDGPMPAACLLANTINAARRQAGLA